MLSPGMYQEYQGYPISEPDPGQRDEVTLHPCHLLSKSAGSFRGGG